MTNDERWLVARYCGWTVQKCESPECGPGCTSWVMLRDGNQIDPDDGEAGWWPREPTIDEIACDLPRFDSGPAQVVPMLEALAKDGRDPWLLPSRRDDMGKWFVQTKGRKTVEHYPQATIPAAVFAACLACAKEKFGDQ